LREEAFPRGLFALGRQLIGTVRRESRASLAGCQTAHFVAAQRADHLLDRLLICGRHRAPFLSWLVGAGPESVRLSCSGGAPAAGRPQIIDASSFALAPSSPAPSSSATFQAATCDARPGPTSRRPDTRRSGRNENPSARGRPGGARRRRGCAGRP